MIPNVEAGATVKLWTFWLSPTFDDDIKATTRRDVVRCAVACWR